MKTVYSVIAAALIFCFGAAAQPYTFFPSGHGFLFPAAIPIAPRPIDSAEILSLPPAAAVDAVDTEPEWADSVVIPVSGFRNNCFFNALRHYGIDISRERVVDRLRFFIANRNSPEHQAEYQRWQHAVVPLALREAANTREEELPEPILDALDIFLQHPDENLENILDELDFNELFDWFAEHLAENTPMPFMPDAEWQNRGTDFLELLGEAFGFNLRIVQGFDLLYDFRHLMRNATRHITLQYIPGQVGHFNIVAPQNDLPQTRALGRIFRLGKKIAEGGHGTVYEIHYQDGPAGQYCVKRSSKIRTFRRELSLLVRLLHPSIPAYVESFEMSDINLIILEQAPGESLRHLLYRLGPEPLNEDEIMAYGCQILMVLAYLHQHHIMHRDLKPANVIIDREHRLLKVIDFGLAARRCDATHATGFETKAGTPGYQAPEIARGERYGFAGDMWSLGATMYRIAEGQRVPEPPTAPTTRSAELNRLVGAFLRIDPLQRPTALEALRYDFVQRHLRAFLASLEAGWLADTIRVYLARP